MVIFGNANIHAIMRLYRVRYNNAMVSTEHQGQHSTLKCYFAEAALMRDLISALEEGTLSAET